jgi:hypothetical protein
MADDTEDDGPGIVDRALRDRTAQQIETFIEALDDALVNPTPDAIDDLRESADKLMRAIARVLLELERANRTP